MNPLGFLKNRKKQAAENIDRIARRIEKFWDQPVKDSASLLINNVIKDSESRPASTAAA